MAVDFIHFEGSHDARTPSKSESKRQRKSSQHELDLTHDTPRAKRQEINMRKSSDFKSQYITVIAV